VAVSEPSRGDGRDEKPSASNETAGLEGVSLIADFCCFMLHQVLTHFGSLRTAGDTTEGGAAAERKFDEDPAAACGQLVRRAPAAGER